MNSLRTSSLFLAISLSLITASCTRSSNSQAKSETENTTESSAKLDKILTQISQGRAKVKKTFEGPDGLVGVIAEDDQGRSMVLWASPGGQVLLPGPAIDSSGNILNDTMRLELGLDSGPEATLTQASHPNARGIVQGTSGPIVTVFIDPNCVHCNHFFRDTQKPVKDGVFRVRYILTGFLNDTSKGIAASILSSDDPLKALINAEKQYDDTKNRSAVPPLKNIPEEIENTLSGNIKLLQATGKVSTPTLLFCGKTDKKVQLSHGVPSDIADLAGIIGDEGHPACK